MVDTDFLTALSIAGIVVIVGVVAILNLFMDRDRQKREQEETFRLR